MAESAARVVAVTAEAVWVEPERPAGCASCGSASR
ncbi:MAG: Fis family transcriptional regulator, partial [Alphaproteobacteria bacterium]|nr:Fis family transcriptional regulator [Alphaproteobacteria bacterium]